MNLKGGKLFFRSGLHVQLLITVTVWKRSRDYCTLCSHSVKKLLRKWPHTSRTFNDLYRYAVYVRACACVSQPHSSLRMHYGKCIRSKGIRFLYSDNSGNAAKLVK